MKGYTITSFARANGYSVRTVSAAVRGERSGRKSQAILARIKEVVRAR